MAGINRGRRWAAARGSWTTVVEGGGVAIGIFEWICRESGGVKGLATPAPNNSVSLKMAPRHFAADRPKINDCCNKQGQDTTFKDLRSSTPCCSKTLHEGIS